MQDVFLIYLTIFTWNFKKTTANAICAEKTAFASLLEKPFSVGMPDIERL